MSVSVIFGGDGKAILALIKNSLSLRGMQTQPCPFLFISEFVYFDICFH